MRSSLPVPPRTFAHARCRQGKPKKPGVIVVGEPTGPRPVGVEVHSWPRPSRSTTRARHLIVLAPGRRTFFAMRRRRASLIHMWIACMSVTATYRGRGVRGRCLGRTGLRGCHPVKDGECCVFASVQGLQRSQGARITHRSIAVGPPTRMGWRRLTRRLPSAVRGTRQGRSG
jgi:hypothetical protein